MSVRLEEHGMRYIRLLVIGLVCALGIGGFYLGLNLPLSPESAHGTPPHVDPSPALAWADTLGLTLAAPPHGYAKDRFTLHLADGTLVSIWCPGGTSERCRVMHNE